MSAVCVVDQLSLRCNYKDFCELLRFFSHWNLRMDLFNEMNAGLRTRAFRSLIAAMNYLQLLHLLYENSDASA
jgi:hypothetical protein